MTRPVSKELEEQNRQVIQVRATSESYQIESGARIQQVADRTQSCENKVSEVAVKQGKQFAELWSRMEKVVGAVEQVRLSGRGTGVSLHGLMNRMDEVEGEVKTLEDTVV